MNSSPANPSEPSPSSTHNDTTPSTPADSREDLSVQEAIEAVSRTPKTLPLKRGATPLFVPATLPDAARPLTSEEAKASEAAPATDAMSENTAASQEHLPRVEFSASPDAPHRASLTLELHCSFPDAIIRYALDAEDVSEEGQQYDSTEKIFLTQNTKVAARAFVGSEAGPLALANFEIIKPSWQKIEPSDQSDPTPHEVSDEARLEGAWHMAAASLRGRLHAHRGGWREDAFRYGLAHAGDGTYSIIVVSDGAGSASLSRVGSNLACQTALDSLCTSLAASAPLSEESQTLIERDLPWLRGAIVEAARLALNKLREESTTRACALSDFSCTLLILVRREWKGQQLCAALQSGDGGIALWNADNALTILGEADHGQQSGETRFLTSNNMETELPARVKFSIRPQLQAVAVMTDGVADDYFPEATRFPELFQAVLPIVSDNERPGAALLEWINYEKKGSSDDRTLVVCWKATESLATEEVKTDGHL